MTGETFQETIDELEQQVYDYLIDEFGESQEKRARGYFVSQSLKELLGFVDDEQIMQIKGRRQVKNKSESVPDLARGHVTDYTRIEEQIRVSFTLDYSRENDGEFSSQEVISRVEDKGLEDVPIERLVFRFEDDELYDHLQALLENTIGLPYKNEFTQPFYAVLESKQADTRNLKQQVEDYHPDRYFKRKNGDRALGFKHRTMDLMALWSHNAWAESQNVLFTHGDSGRKLTMRDVENIVFNRYDSDSPTYGAVNSKLVINRWQRVFGDSRTGLRLWKWTDTEEWVREK